MAKNFKILGDVKIDCDCSRNIRTGRVRVWIECELIIKSLNLYSNSLSAFIDTWNVVLLDGYFCVAPSNLKSWRPSYIQCVL